MAWIRRVRTASGATAVQIAEYVGGRREIVAHVGSAHTEAELGLLLEQARLLLADAGQEELDLGVEPIPAKVDLVAPRVVEEVLFGDEAVPVGQRARVSAPRVVGTSSRLLFNTLAGVYADLGFDVVGDGTFRDLVIARIVEPTSILDMHRVLGELGQVAASEKTMRRTLTRCAERGYRDQIATACFAHAVAAGDVSLVLYDVTTLYFEAENEDALRKVGFSKERRVDPQIVVGLLVDRNGFPLEIGCYEGSKAETQTIIPIVKQFAERHQLADMVVVADAGMLSAVNLKEFDEAGLRFIVGSRGDQGTGRSGLALPLARRRVRRRTGHRYHHPEEPTRDRERLRPQGRAGMGSRAASQLVAGGLGLLGQARCPRQQDADRPGEPRQSSRRRGEGRTDTTVRHDQQRHQEPRRGLTGSGTPASRPEGLRHQHPRRADAGR